MCITGKAVVICRAMLRVKGESCLCTLKVLNVTISLTSVL